MKDKSKWLTKYPEILGKGLYCLNTKRNIILLVSEHRIILALIKKQTNADIN